MMKKYKCPDCGRDLILVTQNSNSCLSSEQFEAVKAGDYYCEHCTGNRGTKGYKYFWIKELEAIKAERMTVYQQQCLKIANSFNHLIENLKLLGQKVRDSSDDSSIAEMVYHEGESDLKDIIEIIEDIEGLYSEIL